MSSAITEKNSDTQDLSMRQYMDDIRQFPLLTPEQERELAARCANGDEDAIRQMVNSNLRLVVSVAREYDRRGVPLMDLIQEGSIGLLAAAKKYDYTREVRFSTYATKGIRRGIIQCLIDHGTMIRVPTHTAERMRKVMVAKIALVQETGSEPTTADIARRCDLSEDKVKKLLQMIPEIGSLDAPVGTEDATLGGFLEDFSAPQPHEQLVREELNQTMDKLLSMLDARQQQILRLHFGMEDNKCHSLEEIGNMLDISKERARQIERQAMDKLKKCGASMGLEDFLSD